MATTTSGPERGTARPPARKYKASDLPLPSATRGAIESLANGFKKKGDYDTIRKQIWESFETSVRVHPPLAHLAYLDAGMCH